MKKDPKKPDDPEDSFEEEGNEWEEVDFLDSSAAEKLKKMCYKTFPRDKIDEFENYTILEELGRGRMGIVYKAMHKRTNKLYAIKILPEKVLHDPQAVQRFFQEICIQSSLSHENIIRLHQVGVCKETVFIVMEYVAGYDLDTLIKKESLDELQALTFLVSILEALNHAHQQNIVHRDLKPANILVEGITKKPKIADFGLAKLASQDIATDDAFGTPAYMAPEQIISGKDVDVRADIYALGSILYHLLSGKRPYYHLEDPKLLLQAKTKEDPQPIETLVPSIHEKVKTMVRESMTRDVKSRYQSTKEFLADAREALEQIKKEKSAYRAFPTAPTAPTTPTPEERTNKLSGPMCEEILMTATRYELDPVLHTFQKEVQAFNQSFVGSILAEEAKEGKGEFEETLLSITKVAQGALKISAEDQKLMRKNFHKDMLSTILIILKVEKLNAQQKKTFGELKYLLLLRGNVLTKRTTILDVINQGTQFLGKKLDELSALTQSPAFNKEVRAYFDQLIGSILKKYDEIFVEEMRACQDYDELDCYLQNYPLTSTSLLKTYKSLQIIGKVKEVKESLNRSPQQLAAILDKYLGKTPTPLHSIFRKLHSTREEESSLWRMIERTTTTSDLVSNLGRFEQKKEFQGIASRMKGLIAAFMNVGARMTLKDLKASLNFIPQKYCSKICQLVTRKLKSELEQKIQELLKFEGNERKRVNDLMALLRNPRYHEKIALYGYDVKDLANKIAELHAQPDDAQLAAFKEKLPKELVSLLSQDKNSESSSRLKTVDSCIIKLQQMEKQMSMGTLSTLFKVMIEMFKTYGKVNFAKSDSIYAVDGYQIARTLVQYYNEHFKEPIELPENLREEITASVKKLVELEKKRQNKYSRY